MPDNANEWRKFRVVARSHPCVPCFVLCFIGVKTEEFLDFQGRAGSISIVRWNLRPVIFGCRKMTQKQSRMVPKNDQKKQGPTPFCLPLLQHVAPCTPCSSNHSCIPWRHQCAKQSILESKTTKHFSQFHQRQGKGHFLTEHA